MVNTFHMPFDHPYVHLSEVSSNTSHNFLNCHMNFMVVSGFCELYVSFMSLVVAEICECLNISSLSVVHHTHIFSSIYFSISCNHNVKLFKFYILPFISFLCHWAI